jgi:hypothetical protein
MTVDFKLNFVRDNAEIEKKLSLNNDIVSILFQFIDRNPTLIQKPVLPSITFNTSSSSSIEQSPARTPEYLSVESFADANGITKPTGSKATDIDQLIRDLTLSGFTLETGNVYGFGSIQFGTLNLANPNLFRHTSPNINSIVYSEGRGVKSDLTSQSYFNTQYAVNERSGIQNSFTVAIYISEESTETGTGKYVFGSRGQNNTTTQKRIRPMLNSTGGQMQGYSANSTFSNSNHKGLYILTSDGEKVTLYKDYGGNGIGVKHVQSVTPSAPLLSNKEFFLAFNDSTNGGVSPQFRYDKFANIFLRFIEPCTDEKAIKLKVITDQFLSKQSE